MQILTWNTEATQNKTSIKMVNPFKMALHVEGAAGRMVLTSLSNEREHSSVGPQAEMLVFNRNTRFTAGVWFENRLSPKYNLDPDTD